MPKLQIGDECTEALRQTATSNDVECVAGSTCLPADDPDNPKDVPTCVKRGVEGEPCVVDDDCDYDFYCDSGDCTEKGDAGDACSFRDPDDPRPGQEDVPCKAGLSCHPIEQVCFEPCTLNFTCNGNDALCPEGSGCAPLEVAESTATFTVCTELGTSADALCNTDADCASNRYCDGTHCQATKQAGDSCGAHKECATGLHCDLAGTQTCVTNVAPMGACTDSAQCGPNSAGCLDTGAGGLVCRRNLLANGEECGANSACASGRCEVASPDESVATCVAGSAVGAACDNLPTDGSALSCRPGLHCLGFTGAVASGECVRLAGPGEECTLDGATPLCANGRACSDVWNEGEICTDAPVPEASGGTGLVCDGA